MKPNSRQYNRFLIFSRHRICTCRFYHTRGIILALDSIDQKQSFFSTCIYYRFSFSLCNNNSVAILKETSIISKVKKLEKKSNYIIADRHKSKLRFIQRLSSCFEMFWMSSSTAIWIPRKVSALRLDDSNTVSNTTFNGLAS